MQKLSQTKGFFLSFERKALHRNLPIDCLTTAGFLLNINNVQSMLTKPELGKAVPIPLSPAVAVASFHSTADVSCWGDEASWACPGDTPVNASDARGQHQTWRLRQNKRP